MLNVSCETTYFVSAPPCCLYVCFRDLLSLKSELDLIEAPFLLNLIPGNGFSFL